MTEAAQTSVWELLTVSSRPPRTGDWPWEQQFGTLGVLNLMLALGYGFCRRQREALNLICVSPETQNILQNSKVFHSSSLLSVLKGKTAVRVWNAWELISVCLVRLNKWP